MAYGGNDWLALTEEPTLEPEMPICDAHHHFWDFRRERVPYHRYLLHELMADVNSGHNVRSTVFIEARSMYRPGGPEELRPVGEVEFVQGLAAASASGIYGPARAAAAIIGHANLTLGDDVERSWTPSRKQAPTASGGIRHSVGWDPHPEIENRGFEHQLADQQFPVRRQSAGAKGTGLREYGLLFPQLAEVAEFARAVPDLTIVSNHICGLMRVGPYGDRDDEVIPAWREGVATLAQCPNVVVKLGGVGQPRYGFDWHLRETPIGSEELAEAMAPLMTYCIERFGPGPGHVRE